jgi:hypothetical protein
MRSMTMAAILAAFAAPTALAQTVTVTVEGPANANPGDVVQISVFAESLDLPSSGAIAGYGLDLSVTAGSSAVTGLSPAISPVLVLGTQPGTPGTSTLQRAVGGQLSNLFGLNPAIDQSSKILLYTTDLSIDAGAGSGTEITLEASNSSNGGVIIYPDVAAGSNYVAGEEPGSSVSFVPLTITLAPTPGCQGDVNGDGATDVFDFGDLAANFGAGPDATREQGDLNGDGFVDVFDFGDLAADFGCTSD